MHGTVNVKKAPALRYRIMYDSALVRIWKQEALNWQKTIFRRLFGATVENNENRYGILHTGLDLNRAIFDYKSQALPPEPTPSFNLHSLAIVS
jgi:hypothetical protein